MQNNIEHPTPEDDKFRRQEGRKASEQNKDTQYLDGEALEDDLIDVDTDSNSDNRTGPEHPENQEWNIREENNRSTRQY